MKYNPADAEQVAEARRKAREADERYLDALRNVLQSNDGMIVMRRLAGNGNLLNDPMTGNSNTFYNLGAHGMVRKLLADVRAAFDKNSEYEAIIGKLLNSREE